MIKGFYRLLLGCMFLLPFGAVKAQSASDEGSAVKLGSGAKIINTIIWGNKGNQWDETGTATNAYIQGREAGVEGSLLFQDSINGDFRLKTGSPAIDAGSDDAKTLLGPLDLWGNQRISGNAVDIGAYEYQLYKITFIKDKEVVVEQVKGCDSTGVEPGGTYRFMVKANFAGLEAKDVTVKVVGAPDNPITPTTEGGIYELSPVNSDLTVEITLTPPITVTVVEAENGTLTVTGAKGQTAPSGESKGIVVAENEQITLNTTADLGFYCKNVWMRLQTDAEDAWTSIMEKVGTGKGLVVTASMYCKAEFAPCDYPLVLAVNDYNRGSLSVTSNTTTPKTYSLTTNTTTHTVTYAKDLTFTVTATPKTGYVLQSLQVQDADEKNAADLQNGGKAAIRVGGIRIVAEFVPEAFHVKWKCENGDLTVVGGGTKTTDNDGYFKVPVDYGTQITITPQPAEGYEYVPGSLKATPVGESATVISDQTKTWTVEKNTTLTAEFKKKRVPITITQTGLDAAAATGYYQVEEGTLDGEMTVEYGTALTLKALPPTGYKCTGITANGEKTTGAFQSITTAQQIQFAFERIPYEIRFTNTNPTYGTLRVERKEVGQTAWAPFVTSPGTALYGEMIQVTVTPKTGYRLKNLTVNGQDETAKFGEDGGNQIYTVSKDYTITAEFEPRMYTITLTKATGTDIHPNEGTITLTATLTTGNRSIALDFGENGPETIELPYGTVVACAMQTKQNYAPTVLTKTVEGGNPTDILEFQNFTVEGNTEIEVTIKASTARYKVDWIVVKPDNSTSTFAVTAETTAGTTSVPNGDEVFVGTSLNLNATAAAGEMLWSITDQQGNPVPSPYAVTGDVTFTVTFVPTCTLVIQELTGMTLSVRAGENFPLPDGTSASVGTALKNGDVIPVGVKLEAILASGYNCAETLTANGTELARATVEAGKKPKPMDWTAYTVPENPTNGQVVFSGTGRAYVSLIYRDAQYADFYVEVGNTPTRLEAGQTYYYPQSTQVNVCVKDIWDGYVLSENKFYNHQGGGQGVEEKFVLVGQDGAYIGSYSLIKDSDLSVVLEKDTYWVNLFVEWPAGLDSTAVGKIVLQDETPKSLDGTGKFETHHGYWVEFSGKTEPGFEMQLFSADGTLLQEGTDLTWTQPKVTADLSLTVRFVRLYQVNYETMEIAEVRRADGTSVASGDYVREGERLTALSVLPVVGQECKRVMVRKASNENEDAAASSTVAADAKGQITHTFAMPAEDVKIKAEFGARRYDLDCSVNDPNAGTIRVLRYNNDNGTWETVTPGTDVLAYGDRLAVVVALASNYYEEESLNGTVGSETLTFLSASVDGLEWTHEVKETVSGDVTISATLRRKTCDVHLQFSPAPLGSVIELQVGTAKPQQYTALQIVKVPMGETIAARVNTDGLEEGYELTFFPEQGKRLDPFTLPKIEGPLYLTAKFDLKKYLLTVECEPMTGGSVSINGPGGSYSVAGSPYPIEHGTSLGPVTVTLASDYYRLKTLTGEMGGTDQFAGQSEGNWAIAKVTDTVNVKAVFERMYKIVLGTGVAPESLKIDEGDTPQSAIGRFYPEGQTLTLVPVPENGYECTEVVVRGNSMPAVRVPIDPVSGIAAYTIPADCPAEDLAFEPVFQPKKYNVRVIVQPEGAVEALKIFATPQGGVPVEIDNVNGSLVEYGSTLQVDTATLQLHRWYERPVTVTAVMQGNPTEYDLTAGNLVVTDSVTITVTARRKQKKLSVVMEAEAGCTGNQVVVALGDSLPTSFSVDGKMTVDVGVPVKVSCVEGEGAQTVLLTDNGSTIITTAPFEFSLAEMPDEDITVNARFQLKRYPVYYTTSVGGQIQVDWTFNGATGVLAASGEEVKHFTALAIQATPLHAGYRLKENGLTVSMGNVPVTGTTIASVTGAVNIQADFERIYEVRAIAPDSAQGSLAVERADTNAVGSRYVADTELTVKAFPQTGYEIGGITLNGQPLTGMPTEGGEIRCVIPDEPTQDSLEFAVQYRLKTYEVRFMVEGTGSLTVDGLPGGALLLEGPDNKTRHPQHFTKLNLKALCQSPYLIKKFNIIRENGETIALTDAVGGLQADTTWEITGNLVIEVAFGKYYWVVFNDPDHGDLAVSADGKAAVSGERYPGETDLNINMNPDEGYEAARLTANGSEVPNHGYFRLPAAADYDTLRIEGAFQLKMCRLTVNQPANGYIAVEKKNAAGVWEALDVTTSLDLEYWSEIRVSAGVLQPEGYQLIALTANSTAIQSGDSWTMRGDCAISVKVEPVKYVVTYEHPERGTFRIVTADGQEILSGDSVAYASVVHVAVELDDPEGYHWASTTANGQEIGQDVDYTVLTHTDFAALIEINRWAVFTNVSGEGSVRLTDMSGRELMTPKDSTDHYTVVKVQPIPQAGWLLYGLDVYGAELRSDSTIVVTEEVEIRATFRQSEPMLFPAVFTPNSDGKNDFFVISGLWQVPNNKLEIFDRNQKKMYSASPYQNDWDGTTDNGKVLPAGNYVYKLTLPNGETYMGMVSIVRN